MSLQLDEPNLNCFLW